MRNHDSLIPFVVVVIFASFVSWWTISSTFNETASHSMKVIATAPLSLTVETLDGQKLDIANPYPKIQDGWYVSLTQNNEAEWQVDQFWPSNPRNKE